MKFLGTSGTRSIVTPLTCGLLVLNTLAGLVWWFYPNMWSIHISNTTPITMTIVMAGLAQFTFVSELAFAAFVGSVFGAVLVVSRQYPAPK